MTRPGGLCRQGLRQVLPIVGLAWGTSHGLGLREREGRRTSVGLACCLSMRLAALCHSAQVLVSGFHWLRGAPPWKASLPVQIHTSALQGPSGGWRL